MLGWVFISGVVSAPIMIKIPKAIMYVSLIIMYYMLLYWYKSWVLGLPVYIIGFKFGYVSVFIIPSTMYMASSVLTVLTPWFGMKFIIVCISFSGFMFSLFIIS